MIKKNGFVRVLAALAAAMAAGAGVAAPRVEVDLVLRSATVVDVAEGRLLERAQRDQMLNEVQQWVAKQ